MSPSIQIVYTLDLRETTIPPTTEMIMHTIAMKNFGDSEHLGADVADKSTKNGRNKIGFNAVSV